MCFVRLPVEREGLHLIPLYEELAVVVVPLEHPVAAYDELPLADLADEQLVAGEVEGWDEIATATPLDFPEMTVKEAFEVVASGTGIAIVPMSVARLHHRKDLVHRPVTDVAPTQIGLAWLVDNEDDRLERFIGVVRGRRETSSRGDQQPEPAAKKAKRSTAAKPAKKAQPKRTAPRSSAPPRAVRDAADGSGWSRSRRPRFALQGPTLQRSKDSRVHTRQEVGACRAARFDADQEPHVRRVRLPRPT